MTTAGEHKKALNQAEKIEQEFITLMTGQKEKLEQPEERQMVATLTPYTVHIASFPACRLTPYTNLSLTVYDAYC